LNKILIDSHCHAWKTWPYRPTVPDPESHGSIEQLIYEMDGNQVSLACVVCAQIELNPDNNTYIAESVERFPNRLHQFADLDSEWSKTYHLPGVLKRLNMLVRRWPIAGFTHYLVKEEDGAWLHSNEGLSLLEEAANRRLIASFSCYPHQQEAIRKAAERVPNLPILCHHMGHPRFGKGSLDENLEQLRLSSRVPNIYLKVSGFYYGEQKPWEYPFPKSLDLLKTLYDSFGPERLCWGSDFPVSRFYVTYQQTVEAFRSHASFIPSPDKDLILGINLARLLKILE